MKFGKMSRIGKKPIQIPENVKVEIEEQKITIRGPKGELFLNIRPEIEVKVADKEILVIPKINTKNTKAFWGLTRVLLSNMIKGITKGYEKKLEIQGIGYKFQLSGNNLLINVGLSHPIEIKAPSGINFSIEKNIITVSGINKELVGQIAANIKKVKPVEPYKGKGIKYVGEIVRRKAGKKAIAKK